MNKFVTGTAERGIYEIRELLKMLQGAPGGAWVCGGYARYCASPVNANLNTVGDLDIYCANQASYDYVCNELWQSVKGSNGLTKKIFNSDIGEISKGFETPNASTFFVERSYVYSGPKLIQVIKPQTNGNIKTEGGLETILDNFDFTIARVGLYQDFNSGEIVVVKDIDFDYHEKVNILVIKNIHCPIGTALRVAKYSRKGYEIHVLEMAKLFFDYEKQTDEYKSNLKNDMNELAKMLSEKHGSNKSFDYDIDNGPVDSNGYPVAGVFRVRPSDQELNEAYQSIYSKLSID